MSETSLILTSTDVPSSNVHHLKKHLAALDEQFRKVQLTQSEWNQVNENLVSDVIPKLTSFIKEENDICKYALDLFSHQVVNENLLPEHWFPFFKLATSAFTVSTANKVRVAGLELIQKLLLTHKKNVDRLKKIDGYGKINQFVRNGLFGVLSRSSRASPSLVQSINALLGLFCEFDPSLMQEHESTVKRCLMSQLLEQMNSSVAKVDISIIDGCFKGLDHCLTSFSIGEHKDKLYDALKKCSYYPDDGGRRFHYRSGLSVFAHHCKIWSQELIEFDECKIWFNNLKTWAQCINADDHKLGWRCMDAFLRTICEMFVEGNEKSFYFLFNEFKSFTTSHSSKKEKIMGILGYASLAYACKLYMGQSVVDVMLETLVEKTIEIYSTSSEEEKDEWRIFFPNHINAISSVLQQVSYPQMDQLLSIESLVVQLVIEYPKLPPQFHAFAVEAFVKINKHLNVNTVILQSLLHSCSFPLVTDSDQDAISTKSYSRFWADVVNGEDIRDAAIQAILEIIDRLEFATDTYELLVNDQHEIIEETLDGSLTQAIKEEALNEGTSVMLKKVKRPKKVKDHTVLANLVIVFNSFPPLHDKWLALLIKLLMSKSTQFPEVSSFYKLLSSALNDASKKKMFDCDRNLFKMCCHFLIEVIEKCLAFDHELLVSFLKLLTHLPLELVRELLPNLSAPFAKIFRQRSQLVLVEQGIDAIEAWTASLGHEIMDCFFVEIIPSMRKFLDRETLELLEESVKEKTSIDKKKSASVEIIENPILERIQFKLMMFFGSIDSRLHYLLLPSQDELSEMAVAWDADEQLDFEIPFPDMNFSVQLGALLPRVVELSLNSTHRRTRMAACETLHVLIIYMIGKEATDAQQGSSYAKLYAKIFPVMLKLASDEDTVIGTCLFEKLLVQVIHQMTRRPPNRDQFDGSIVLVDSLLDALTFQEDKEVKQMAKKMLYECLKWSIKQSSSKSVKLLMTRLYSMWTHPTHAKRQAGSAAFNSFYTVFRENEEMVSIYTIELFSFAFKSLQMSRECEETKDCINHLLRIIKAKTMLFQKKDLNRRIPTYFTDDGLKDGTMSDLLCFLIPMMAKTETDVRRKAMEAIFYLFPSCLSQKITESGFVGRLTAVMNRSECSDLEAILCSIELSNWMVEQGIVELHQVKLKLDNFLNCLCNDTLLSKSETGKTPKEAAKYRFQVCSIVVQYLKWLSHLNFEKMTQVDKKLITLAIYKPSVIGFDARNQAELRKSMERLISKCSITDFLLPLFGQNFEECMQEFLKEQLGQKVLEQLQGLNYMLRVIQKHGLPNLAIYNIADVILKGIHSPARDVICEMVKLLSHLHLDYTKLFLETSVIYNACEDVILNSCLRYSYEELKLPVPTLIRFVKFMATKKHCLPSTLVEKWAMTVLNHWSVIADPNKPRKLDIFLCKFLIQIAPQAAKVILSEWYFRILKAKVGELKVKINALDLLYSFHTTDDDHDERLETIVQVLVEHLPLTSTELIVGTELHRNYFALLQKLMTFLQITGSKVIFICLLQLIARENDHPILDTLRVCLQKTKKKQPLLEAALDCTQGKQNIGLEKCVRICDGCFIPLLEGSNNMVIMDFYSSCIETLLKAIMDDNDYRQLVALKLISQLYTKASKDVVHSKGSKVTFKAFEYLKSRGETKDSQYSGKELSQFLVKKLKIMRSNINLIPEVRCEAFNSLMAIFTCIQDSEKLFFNFLFKEDVSSPIWSRIITCDQAWRFALESTTESLPAKRKTIVAIKKATLEETGVVSKRKVHFLSDCTLSQEITSFDFNESIVSTQMTNQDYKETHVEHIEMNVLDLEQDDIAIHSPCLAPFVALLKFMNDKGILNQDKLPDSLNALKTKLSEEICHPNVKLFILKTILLAADVFKPFAKHFIGAILSVILKSATWNNGPIVNCFSLDILTMLATSWGDVAPDGDRVEKSLASECIVLLANAAHQSGRREIMRYILDLVYLLIGKWKSCLSLDYLSICSLFSNKEDMTQNIVGIHVLGFMFSSGLSPAKVSIDSLTSIFQKLAINIDCHKKEIAQTTAEVLGLSLKHFKERGDKEEELKVLGITKGILTKWQKASGAKSREKFVLSLYMVFQHYPSIVENFTSSFVYSLSTIHQGLQLVQCVEMLQGAVPCLVTNVKEGGSWTKEFAMIKINDLLTGCLSSSSSRVPLNTLLFIEKALEHFSQEDKVLKNEIASHLQPLSSHPNVEVRRKMYEILQILCLDNVTKASDLLMNGLADSDPTILQDTVNFIERHQMQRFQNTISRTKHLLSNVLQSSCKSSFVSVFCDLSLSHTEASPRITSVLFRSLADSSAYQKMNINTSWRSQYERDIDAPMFAETLSSTQSSPSTASQSSSVGMVLATQSGLDFVPTQMMNESPRKSQPTGGRVFISSIVSTQTSSSFKVSPNDRSFGQPMIPRHVENDADEVDQAVSSVRIGKRFQPKASHEETKSRFAKMHQRKLSRLELAEKELRGRRQAQVTLKRTYRDGELPDIMITSKDIITPLRALIYRDNEIAQILASLILRGINDHGSDNDLMNLVMSRVVEHDLLSKHFAKTLLETCLSFKPDQLECLDDSRLMLMSKQLRLEMTAILVLEKKPKSIHANEKAKRRKTDFGSDHYNMDTLYSLVNLYKSIGDHSSARGLYLQESPNGNELIMAAMAQDSMNRFRSCKKSYMALLNEAQDEAQRRLWQEQYLHSLEMLCDWPGIEKQVSSKDLRPEFNTEWGKSVLQPTFFQAALHLQIEAKDKENIVMDYMDRSDLLKKAFPLVWASFLHLKQQQAEDRQAGFGRIAHQWSEEAMKQCLFQWLNKNPYDQGSHRQVIYNMQQACNFIRPDMSRNNIMRQFGINLQNNDHLLCQWKIRSKEDPSSLQALSFECLKIALEQHQSDVAIKALKSLAAEIPEVNDQPDFILYKTLMTLEQCSFAPEMTNKDRFRHLFSCLIKCDADIFQRLPLMKQSSVKGSLLQEMAKIISQSQADDSVMSVIDADIEKKRHLEKLMQKHQETNMVQAMKQEAICQIKGVSCHLDCDGQWTLANYCYDIIQSFPDVVSEEIILCLLDAHFSSIIQGSLTAMKLFPKLLLLLESLSSFIGKHSKVEMKFKETLRELPAWTVLPWSNQLLSLLPNYSPFIYPLLIKLAKEFPQTMCLAFNFVSQEVKDKHGELKAILRPSRVLELIFTSLEKVSLPTIRLQDFISGMRTAKNPLKLWEEFESANFSVAPPQSKAEKQFFNTQAKSVLVDLVKKCQKYDINDKLRLKALEEAKNLLNKTTQKITKLSDLSPDLAIYSKYSFTDSVQIPGQFDKMKFARVDKDQSIKIAAFKDEVRVFASMRRPIRITMIGDDGKDYDFIVKCGEDIRQDQRIEQIFGIANNIAKGSIVTYSVIPISNSLGLLQFVPNTKTLDAMLPKDLKKKSDIPELFVHQPGSPFTRLKQLLRSDSSYLRKIYREQVVSGLLNGGFQLRDAFLKNSFSPEGFFHLRKNFMISHGEVCLMGYILGLGDRHATNMLISLTDGRSVAIDFGYSFGSSFFLRIPELVPFRMTPVIQGLMYPFKNQGPFKDAMLTMLQKLKESKDVLMCALSLFIKEPSMNWIEESKRFKSVENMSDDRIDIVRKKLDFQDPTEIINYQLEKYYSKIYPDAARLVPEMKTTVSEHSLGKVNLNAEEVVRILINIASDEAILSLAFKGWSPYL